MAKEEKNEIPDVSPLAKQQPPKMGNMSSGKSSGEPGKLEGGAYAHEKMSDKMTKALCK